MVRRRRGLTWEETEVIESVAERVVLLDMCRVRGRGGGGMSVDGGATRAATDGVLPDRGPGVEMPEPGTARRLVDDPAEGGRALSVAGREMLDEMLESLGMISGLGPRRDFGGRALLDPEPEVDPLPPLL